MKTFKQYLVEGKKLIGYKVMPYKNGKAVSGSDSRQSFIPKKGKVVSMSGDGIYMGLDREYVINYYAVNEENILITFEFDSSKLTTGNLTDREPEFSVPSAKIIDFEVLDEDV